MRISVKDAEKQGEKYIKEPGARAGIATLENHDGKQIYVVPVIMNKNIVGKIYIDPETGENIGGAGGALNGRYD